MTSDNERQSDPRRPRPNNLRTALWLAALAAFFFALVIGKRLWMN